VDYAGHTKRFGHARYKVADGYEKPGRIEPAGLLHGIFGIGGINPDEV
jgi:hypothetical protein